MLRWILRKAYLPMLAACLVLPGAAAAQSPPPLLGAYGRVIALLDFMTTYVGESLLACSERNFLTEVQVESRFRAYRARNAPILERADRWRQQAENRLRSQGEEHAARERAGEAGMGATTMALARVREELDKVRDLRALCAGKAEAIAAGRYDLSLNAELVGLLRAEP